MQSIQTEARRMVERQLKRRGLSDVRVLEAMFEVPRVRFVPGERAGEAYADRALPLSHGQTISQPYIVARMCELAGFEGNERVLEIGTGSGYQAAVLARLGKQVVSIEVIPELAEHARRVLKELEVTNVEVVIGDGSLGYPPQAPYDRILVTAAAPTVPKALLEQLAEGGRMVLPVGRRAMQYLRVVERQGSRVREYDYDACVFVPLVGEGGWKVS